MQGKVAQTPAEREMPRLSVMSVTDGGLFRSWAKISPQAQLLKFLHKQEISEIDKLIKTTTLRCARLDTVFGRQSSHFFR